VEARPGSQLVYLRSADPAGTIVLGEPVPSARHRGLRVPSFVAATLGAVVLAASDA